MPLLTDWPNASDIILTCAEIPLSDILGPSIDIDKSLSPCTIRLDSWDFSRRHYVAIEPPIPYAVCLYRPRHFSIWLRKHCTSNKLTFCALGVSKTSS